MTLETDARRELRQEIQSTFLMFCHLEPNLAQEYLTALRRQRLRHHDMKLILRCCGPLAKATPGALVDFMIDVLFPPDDPDELYRRRSMGPFDIRDMDFFPASPGQGPFFELLESAPAEGLQLIRRIVEHATHWRGDDAHRSRLPSLTIPFPDGAKTFVGHFGTYQCGRGHNGPLVVASALMALEAWAHRQIEGGRSFKDVMDDILGPSGSSVAFVCVAVDLTLSHWDVAKECAWPLVASPDLLVFDDMRHTHDAMGLGRFTGQEDANKAWRVKLGDLAARPSRKIRLSDQIGRLTINRPAEVHAKLRQALQQACESITQEPRPVDEDPVRGLHATAQRAWRMSDAANWAPRTIQLAGGRQIEVLQYQAEAEEAAAANAAQEAATADIGETNRRLSVQRAFLEPSISTPEIVAGGVAWAKSTPRSEPSEDFEAQWRERARIMAAATAARDYEGHDREDMEAWCRSLFGWAIAGDNDDLPGRHSSQIEYNAVAIAAVGYGALYRRNRDAETLNMLFRLATRAEQAVGAAIGRFVCEINRLDGRLARSFTRIVFASAVRPRHTFSESADRIATEAHTQRVSEAIAAEEAWLAGGRGEPEWPDLARWPSRRRRHIRIGSALSVEDRVPEEMLPETYLDERTLRHFVGHLATLAQSSVDEWLVGLARRLLAWTIEANNGPNGGEEEREGRPYEWNSEFFDFLGVLCGPLAYERSRTLFLEPVTMLHDGAYYDAAQSFLNGFDRATSIDPANSAAKPVAVRALVAERLMRGRCWRRVTEKKSSSAEVHLGHALHALFFHHPLMGGKGRPYLPERCARLPEFMPTLTAVVVAAPLSGYVAWLFLGLIETYPGAALLPYMVKAAAAWANARGVDPVFWSEQQAGRRVCAWITAVLDEDPDSLRRVPGLREPLMTSLDIMIRSGVTQARDLEILVTAAELPTA